MINIIVTKLQPWTSLQHPNNGQTHNVIIQRKSLHAIALHFPYWAFNYALAPSLAFRAIANFHVVIFLMPINTGQNFWQSHPAVFHLPDKLVHWSKKDAITVGIQSVERGQCIYCWWNKSMHNTSEIFFQLGLVTWIANYKQFAIICNSLLLVYWSSYQIQTNFNNDVLELVLLFFVACCYHNSLP